MKISNIEWDTDGEEVGDLPDSVTVPDGIDEDDVADYLSDTYGFCVVGFEIG